MTKGEGIMADGRFRVLLTDRSWPDVSVEAEVLGAIGAEVVEPTDSSMEAFHAAAVGVDAILSCWRILPESVLELAPKCKIISVYGIGTDNVPMPAATKRGIPVTNVPDYCMDEVSDHALALLLAANRRVVEFANETRAGFWNSVAAGKLQRLRGKTLGLVGYGNIARRLAEKSPAFGLEVVAWGRSLDEGPLPDGRGRGTRDLHGMLGVADFVSLHVPLRTETTGLIGETELRAMQPHAWVINTARGGVIDEAAMLRALTEGWIAGLAADVLAEEPPAANHPFMALPNTILTPHVAYSTRDSLLELRRRASEHVAIALQGGTPPHVVNL